VPQPFISPTTSAPHGHYAHAIRAGSFLFISGILGHDGQGVEAPEIGTQAARCLRDLEIIINEAGGELSGVVKVCIFTTDAALWPRINSVYADFFGPTRPARIVVPCGPMRFGSLIEMDAIAFIDEVASPGLDAVDHRL